MAKSNVELLMEIYNLIKAIPAPATTVLDVTTYQKSCRDYQEAMYFISTILTNYATYEKWKSRLGKGELDDDYILDCKDNVDEYLQKFKQFVNERQEEGWN